MWALLRNAWWCSPSAQIRPKHRRRSAASNNEICLRRAPTSVGVSCCSPTGFLPASTIAPVKNWDVIVIGGGVIGLALSLELRRSGASVLVLDRGEPGREASYASGGMIAWCDPHLDSRLVELAKASAKLYPPLARELEAETGELVGLREHGAILFLRANEKPRAGRELSEEAVRELEPNVVVTGHQAFFVPEASIDPRALVLALLKAAKNR